MKKRSEVEFEVRYAETDQMGIVHHANYLIWFEQARTRFCTEAGQPYPEIEALGYFMIITQAQQDYKLAACYGDTVKVSCWLDWVASRSLQFCYKVVRGEQVLSTGYTRRYVRAFNHQLSHAAASETHPLGIYSTWFQT